MLVWLLALLGYLYHAIRVYVVDVFFQKLFMLHLPANSDDVCGNAKGLTVIVTGPTSGIGTETAATLFRRGAHVVLACRSEKRGEALMQRLARENAHVEEKGSLRLEILDLNSLASVSAFASRWASSGAVCDVLVNNAGIFSMGAPRATTADGFESHIGTNHIAPMLLTLLMLPHMKRGSGRIVTVTSMLHHIARMHTEDPHLLQSYSSEAAYAQSKLANVLMTRELRARLPKESGVTALAVHPGEVLTGVVRSLPEIVQHAYRVLMGAILLSPAEGARASLWAATSAEAPAAAEVTDGYIHSNCRAVAPSAEASNNERSAWLWEWSEKQLEAAGMLPTEYRLPAAPKEERKQQ